MFHASRAADSVDAVDCAKLVTRLLLRRRPPNQMGVKRRASRRVLYPLCVGAPVGQAIELRRARECWVVGGQLMGHGALRCKRCVARELECKGDDEFAKFARVTLQKR
jgi:hypothetical protein